ncbi:MAG: hypothetical protein PWP43_372 [Bacillota bacterium]|nr:hypothetical protein [Bacillota bacterium]
MLEVELTTLGFTLACGVGLGLLFDLWRACRAVLHPGWIVTSAGDLLFWLVAMLVAAATLMLANYGQVRLYVFLSLGAGFGLYQLALSPLLRRPLRLSVRFFYRGAGGALRLLGWPFWFPARLALELMQAGSQGGRRWGRAVQRLIRRKLELLKPNRKS